MLAWVFLRIVGAAEPLAVGVVDICPVVGGVGEGFIVADWNSVGCPGAIVVGRRACGYLLLTQLDLIDGDNRCELCRH